MLWLNQTAIPSWVGFPPINLSIYVPKDFLYLSGILEPDSALVLYGKGRPDQAILFVPRRDPGRELWDGPRSGKDGAAALTGIERVHSTEELGVVLKSLKGGWSGTWGTSLHRDVTPTWICGSHYVTVSWLLIPDHIVLSDSILTTLGEFSLFSLTSNSSITANIIQKFEEVSVMDTF